jgi:AraC-like DNA-binding protein
MVSQRCKMMVKTELNKLGLNYVVVELGMAEIMEEITPEQREELRVNLKKSGLELLDDKRSTLVEKIKYVITELIDYDDEEQKASYTEFISQKMGYDYTYLANIFSEVNGVTIQQFIILNKVERVKEMLIYDELSLTEIAYRLNYSSSAHLANQFKKITGLTPSYFKQLRKKRKIILKAKK